MRVEGGGGKLTEGGWCVSDGECGVVHLLDAVEAGPVLSGGQGRQGSAGEGQGQRTAAVTPSTYHRTQQRLQARRRGGLMAGMRGGGRSS